jgi:hypothetical protein
LAETEGYWPELRSALEHGRISGPQVHDARVAALCCDHGVRELWTSDRDFSRFPTLTVVNPLVGKIWMTSRNNYNVSNAIRYYAKVFETPRPNND